MTDELAKSCHVVNTNSDDFISCWLRYTVSCIWYMANHALPTSLGESGDL